jgi:hypothetical protein
LPIQLISKSAKRHIGDREKPRKPDAETLTQLAPVVFLKG